MVNADDFGMSQVVNTGIIRAVQNGVVTTVAVVANGAAFEEACCFARQHARMSTGLHLNLTQGKPVLPPSDIATLVDTRGRFYNKRAFITGVLSGRIHRAHIEAEVMAQAARMAQQALPITHLNSHHHVHSLPSVAAIATTCALRCGAGWIRTISMPTMRIFRVGGMKALIHHLVTAWMMQRREIDGGKLHSAPRFCGFELATARDKWRALSGILQHLPTGQHELMCHPALLSGAGGELRQNDETAALCDPRLPQIIREKKITLISADGAAVQSF